MLPYRWLSVDKSSYDGKVNWKLAKQRRIAATTCRASYGLTADPLHQSETDNARTEGVHVAPYHYYVPRQGAIAQAEKFLSCTKGGDLPPLVDLEDYGSHMGYAGIWKAEIKPFLNYIEAGIGIRPWCYSSPAFIRAYLSKDTDCTEYKWMIANYDVSAPFLPKPLTPLDIIAWQFGDGRDAPYYGFMEAWGCALYASDDLSEYVKEWTSGLPPEIPPTLPGYTAGRVLVTVKVRGGPGTSFAQIFPWALYAGKSVTVLDIVTQANGDIWIEFEAGKWCAAIYGGQTFIQLS